MMNDPYAYSQQPLHRKPMPPHLQASYSDAPYNHTRTPSSSTARSAHSNHSHPVPSINYPAQSHQQHQQQQAQSPYTSRRTPSANTFSTTAFSGNQRGYPNMSPSQAQRDSDLRRSTSSRSTASTTATSYVQLLRKQKATVWCDRSQTLDARLIASQKAQKLRAQAEMLNESRASRTGTMTTSLSTGAGGVGVGKGMRVTAKIRHHGKSGLTGFSGLESWGVGVGGVPMRLSASEVDGELSDDEDANGQRIHRRTGSGRSSLRQGQYRAAAGQGGRESGRWSRDGTPPSGGTSGRNSLAELAETPETPQVVATPPASSYFASTGSTHPAPDRKNSSGSGSSAERNDAVPDLDAARVASNMVLKSAVGGRGTGRESGIGRQQSTRNPEELRRRGSVDERTATMGLQSGLGRLYIANPDSGDSD